MNEFIFLSLENIDDILVFSQVCKKGNAIYKKWKNEWYTIHTQIVFSVDEDGDKRKTKIIGNRKWESVWWENGTPKYEGKCKDGKRKGKCIRWWGNGNKMNEGEYKDGQAEGKWIIWHYDGNQVYEVEYKDGKKEIKWVGWWCNRPLSRI